MVFGLRRTIQIRKIKTKEAFQKKNFTSSQFTDLINKKLKENQNKKAQDYSIGNYKPLKVNLIYQLYNFSFRDHLYTFDRLKAFVCPKNKGVGFFKDKENSNFKTL